MNALILGKLKQKGEKFGNYLDISGDNGYTMEVDFLSGFRRGEKLPRAERLERRRMRIRDKFWVVGLPSTKGGLHYVR